MSPRSQLDLLSPVDTPMDLMKPLGRKEETASHNRIDTNLVIQLAL
jgi:hypothetical protein